MKKSTFVHRGAKSAVALACVLATGCHFNSTRNNQQGDLKDAQRVTDQFYTLFRKDDDAGIFRLFSSKFFAVTDTTKLKNILIATRQKLGTVTHREVENWQTRVVSGTDSKSEYVLQYAVEHDKFPSNETFTLMKEADDTIRIVGYNVNSDGFF